MPRLSRINRAGVLMGICTIFLATLPVVAGILPVTSEQGTGTVHRVEIRQFTFVPKTITIHAGDSVEWVNLDIAPHTATAVRTSAAGSPDWNTGRLDQAQRRRITFSEVGHADYLCLYHPVMKGSVIVVPDDGNAP